MEAATRNGIPGILAECGGACACATCHVHVEEAWLGKLGTPAELESAMLEFADDVRPNSRLGCQIRITEEMDGLRVSTLKDLR
jgi:2Fe-2S ferredoxin